MRAAITLHEAAPPSVPGPVWLGSGMMNRCRWFVCVWLACGLLACDGGGSKGGVTTAASSAGSASSAAAAATAVLLHDLPLAEALFVTDSHTLNNEGCEDEGAAKKSPKSGTHLFIWTMELSASPSGKVLRTAMCKEPAHCRAVAKAWEKNEEWPNSAFDGPFSKKQTNGHWTGMRQSPGKISDDKKTCVGAILGKTDLRRDKTKLRATLRGARGDIAATEKGECTFPNVAEKLKDAECNLYEVVTAHIVGHL